MLYERGGGGGGGLNSIAKSIAHVTQSAQGDMGRNFSLSLNFLHDDRSFYIRIQSIV